MATRKRKQEDGILERAGITDSNLSPLRGNGHSEIWVYESSGLLEGKWVWCYFPVSKSDLEKQQNEIAAAVSQGRIRNIEKVSI
jgi:hypothetical protein